MSFHKWFSLLPTRWLVFQLHPVCAGAKYDYSDSDYLEPMPLEMLPALPPIRQQTLSDDKDNPAFDIHICFETGFGEGFVPWIKIQNHHPTKGFFVVVFESNNMNGLRFKWYTNQVSYLAKENLKQGIHIYTYFAWNFFCMDDKEWNLVVMKLILETDQLQSIWSGLNLLLGTLTYLNFASDKNPFRE